MTRYYLFERNAEGNLCGKETVISIVESENKMVVISISDLSPNSFREIVLKNDELEEIPVVFEAMLDIEGANPSSVARPYVFRVRRV